MKNSARIILAVSVLVAMAAGLGVGYSLWGTQESPSEAQSLLKEVINRDDRKPQTVDFGLFWDVWNKLHEKFVDSDELDTEALVTGAIQGMVAAAGDPHTVYLEPVRNQKFQEDISGAFSGVGMEIGTRDGFLTVISPIKDSPAERSGIQTGDVIISINDVESSTMPVEQAVDLIRGERGTTVRLGVTREGVQEHLVFPIVRDRIKIPSIELIMLTSDIAYVRLFTFNMNIDEDFGRAARNIVDSGATRLIVDVRNNPGGLLDSAITLGGWFLEKGTVVVQEDFGGGISQSLRSNGQAQLGDLKFVFLINGGSASASEILAGAVHDVLGTRLVGETTFGKGSVQQLESFNNGASLKVTVAKWLTPAGVSISDKGIDPTDEVVLEQAELPDDFEYGVPGKDPQLDRAIEIVNTL